jgi:hypothetical protein
LPGTPRTCTCSGSSTRPARLSRTTDRGVGPYEWDGILWQYPVTIDRDTPGNYGVSDETPVGAASTGMTVRMEMADESAKDLTGDDFRDRLLLRFACYLSPYPTLCVIYGTG